MNPCFHPSVAAPVRTVLLLGTMLTALAGCAQRDMTDLQQFVETTKRTTPMKKPDPPPEIKPYEPFAYTAQGFKDPFGVSPFAQEEELMLTQDVATPSKAAAIPACGPIPTGCGKNWKSIRWAR